MEQHIIAEVVEAAIGPLVETVAKAVGGLVFDAASAAAGANGAPGTGFQVDLAALEAHAHTMHEHAETVAGHAQTFQTKIAGLSFE
ncbi:hypothetical protein ACH4E7_25225 [Kitasatospora sp. NPDC018058]|uniref:hypothetical protein n=1 Tax=Kitasatospora sp. NPDC018058 TaxID=3364025 RepID=UPI0037BEC753